VVVSIGVAGERTIAPDTGEFTRYTLAFSGPEDYDTVELYRGSAVIVLPSGSWTISATGYTGTNGAYTAAAEGRSAQVNVDGGGTSQAAIVLGPLATAAGKGTFSYSISTPPGAAGSLVIAAAEGGVLVGGTIAVTAGTTSAGTKDLDPGYYWARLRLEKDGEHTGFTEALHIYAGLVSALPARTYTDSDFQKTASIEEQTMTPLIGVWYSSYPGLGRLDGYRIGRWKDFDSLMSAAKLSLFPGLGRFTYTAQTGSNVPGANDFFVFYDDTVYGEQEDGEGNGGLGIPMGYIGIVRAVNVFNNDPDRGAIIIEYLRGCAPQWDEDIKDGQLPFFGIYYIKTDADTIKMANAVDLDAMGRDKKYFTETATLQEAINKNTAENESAFVSWEAGQPQKRE
jgi:hypothetical protein